MEEKIEKLSRFVDKIGERIKVNVGTKEKPEYREAYLVKKSTK